jgi:hypothetical protein
MIEPIIIRRSLGFWSADFHAVICGQEWQRRCGGYIDTSDTTREMLPLSQVSALPDEIGIPRFLHVGHETDLAKLYAPGFFADVCGSAGVPDTDFENAVNSVYQEVAWCRKPVLEQVKAVIELPSGLARIVCYHRLVMPAKTVTEKPAIITFTDYCHRDRVTKDIEDPLGRSRQASRSH